MKKAIIALSIAGLMATSTAFATNGYFAHGYSTKEKGMGGAGVAYGQDAMASATNPAGIVGNADRLDVGLALFSPRRNYTVTGAPNDPNGFPLMPGKVDSDNELFAIPHFGMTFGIDDASVVGVAVYGNGGMNTEYTGVDNGANNASGTFYSGTAGVNLKQMFLNVTYARKLDKNNSFGVSLVGAAQTFKATGLMAFATPNPNSPTGATINPSALSNNGTDTSYGGGFKIGWTGAVVDSVILGASYQSKMYMSNFNDYSGLFAEGGNFDIPATATIGLAWNTNDTAVLALDVQQIYYGDVAALSNGVENLQRPDGTGRLGGSNGAGFGWDDMTIVKVGYEFGDATRWRVGASYGEQPIRDGQTMFNILAPAVITTHYTAGFTTPIGTNQEISFAGMYAPSYTVSSAVNAAQVVDLEMSQYEVQGTYAYKF